MKKLLFILCFIGIWYLTCNATQSYLVSNIVQTEEQTPVATEENSTTEESAEPAKEESSESASEETSETAAEETPAEESSQVEEDTSSSSSVSSKESSSSDGASSSQSSSDGEKDNKTKSSSSDDQFGYFCLFVIMLFVVRYIIHGLRYKCPNCGKFNGMKKTGNKRQVWKNYMNEERECKVCHTKKVYRREKSALEKILS